MIKASDRQKAMELINEAMEQGARKCKCCEVLEISERTYYRWEKLFKKTGSYADLRPTTERKATTYVNRKVVLETLNRPEFADLSPAQIVPALADYGEYIASESTFYRILHAEKMNAHRGRTKESKRKEASTHKATAPNQVWTWDITYLKGPIKGSFYYLYLITDLYCRSVVHWEVYEEESAKNASELIQQAVRKEGLISTEPLVLHSDNGSPMKGATMLETLYRLGITPSRSRPRVSNDNPYVESLFKTLKYRPNYQPDGFEDISDARDWVADFVLWYNHEHHHSGIQFLTPNQRRSGEAEQILKSRKEVYEKAKEKYPERWRGRKTRDWTLPECVYLNPPKQADREKENLVA